MTGQPFHATAAVPGSRLEALVHYQRSALAYRARQGPFLVTFGLLGFAVFLAAWLCLRRRRPRGAALVGVAGLAVAALPLAGLVPAISGAESWSVVPFAALIAAADLGLVALALSGPWRRHLLGPPVFLATLSVAAITADLLTGGAAQLNSLIGYSPIVAGRFYGMSAPTFAVFASFVLLLAGLGAGRAGEHRSLVAAGIGLATLVLAGAPMFGAKFGAILTLVPAFGVLSYLLARRRLSGGRIALLGAATAAAGLVIGGLDALRPAASRTHIGRFVASLAGGGTGTVSDVLLRKADVNLGIFLRSPVAYTAPLAVVAMAIVLLRPPPWLAAPLERIPGLRAGLLAALTANALAMFVNDSGVAIPAMGLGVGVPLVLVILLRAQASPGLPEGPDPE